MDFIVCSTFTLSMLDRETQTGTAGRAPAALSASEFKAFLEYQQKRGIEVPIESAVYSPELAKLLGDQLGISLPVCQDSAPRPRVRSQDKVRLLVGEYIGPPLPEGATELPEGAHIEWWLI